MVPEDAESHLLPLPRVERAAHGPGARLGDLVRALDVAGFGSGWQDVRITGLALDSRRTAPGDLFCALAGENAHGLAHWPDAEARGARALLLDRGATPPTRSVGIQADRPRQVLAAMASRLYGNPAADLRLIGVTGTNGKTTTVHMVHQILEAAGRQSGYWSTAWVDGGRGPFRPQMTTPEAPDLQAFLAKARDSGATDAVLEVSSHGVVLDRLAGLRFRAGVATNMTPDHLDFHGSFAAYRAAKERFIAELPADGHAILNASDPVVRTFSRSSQARVVMYGWGAGCDVGAEAVTVDAVSARFRLFVGGAAVTWVNLPVPGRHNVLNALAALAATLTDGIPWQVATAALQRFEAPVRRLEPFVVGPYTVINDVAMNQGSYEAVMAAMRDLERPLVVVNALRGNRGTEVNRAIAETLARWDRELHFAPVVGTTSDPEVARLSVDYRVRPEELEAFLDAADAAGLAVSIHRTLGSAVEEGVERVPPGGVLLLLGTFGMDDGPEWAVRRLARRAGVDFMGLPHTERRRYREPES